MSDYLKKYTARVPIVPDDFVNKNIHKDNELVMDFENDDLYIKRNGEYINITGQIKDQIKQLRDESVTIDIVTEDTLPTISDRIENHWYYVVTRSKIDEDEVPMIDYIYHGLIKESDIGKQYLLIGQNMSIGIDTVLFEVEEGYLPCFYVPHEWTISFTNHLTQESIEYTVQDNVYIFNTSQGTFIPYDVYTLNIFTSGEYLVDIVPVAPKGYIVDFKSNVEDLNELKLPESIEVPRHSNIGSINNPTWNDPRYSFAGWSTSQYTKLLIDLDIYKPEKDHTVLYAWFDFDVTSNWLKYIVTNVSYIPDDYVTYTMINMYDIPDDYTTYTMINISDIPDDYTAYTIINMSDKENI